MQLCILYLQSPQDLAPHAIYSYSQDKLAYPEMPSFGTEGALSYGALITILRVY